VRATRKRASAAAQQYKFTVSNTTTLPLAGRSSYARPARRNSDSVARTRATAAAGVSGGAAADASAGGSSARSNGGASGGAAAAASDAAHGAAGGSPPLADTFYDDTVRVQWAGRVSRPRAGNEWARSYIDIMAKEDAAGEAASLTRAAGSKRTEQVCRGKNKLPSAATHWQQTKKRKKKEKRRKVKRAAP
jgi:hypothetical protein